MNGNIARMDVKLESSMDHNEIIRFAVALADEFGADINECVMGSSEDTLISIGFADNMDAFIEVTDCGASIYKASTKSAERVLNVVDRVFNSTKGGCKHEGLTATIC